MRGRGFDAFDGVSVLCQEKGPWLKKQQVSRKIFNDPSQLRNTVYELARTKLLMLAWEQNPRITVLGLRRMMLSFETAIEHVESHASRQDELPPLLSTANPAHVVNSPERDQGGPVLILNQRPNASEVLDFMTDRASR